MFARQLTRSLPSRLHLVSKRNAGGYLNKNLWVEENAGIRENGYKTWKFTGSGLVSMFFLLFLPGTLFTFTIMDEMKVRDRQIGVQRHYGLYPKTGL
mmetsp:Transcript_14717/g.15913  ORF Transcript_14717/g.15913 Transcript_14717/m.15913 type:complete len:97 (-) Transcript_14717:78-368(-)